MTREQEIQERLNAVGCDNAVDADGFKDVGFLEPDASFYGEASGDITYLLARVKHLEGDVDKYGSLADARATVIEQLKATNAQREARLVSVSIESDDDGDRLVVHQRRADGTGTLLVASIDSALVTIAERPVGGTYSSNIVLVNPQNETDRNAVETAFGIRALATDDAAVEKM